MDSDAMLELLEELSGQLNDLGDKGFGELLQAKGINPDDVMMVAFKVAVMVDREVNVRDWCLSYCLGYMLGHEAALRDLGKAVFGDAES